jgi:hypothetical protein
MKVPLLFFCVGGGVKRMLTKKDKKIETTLMYDLSFLLNFVILRLEIIQQQELQRVP